MERIRTRGLWRSLALVGMGLLLIAWPVGSEGPGRLSARDDSVSPSAPPGLPADLDRVPRDAAAVAVIRVADLWTSPVARELRKQLKKEAEGLPALFTSTFGLTPDQVERATFVQLEPKTDSPNVTLVRALSAYDKGKVLAATGTNGSVTIEQKKTIHLSRGRDLALLVLDDRNYLLGTPAAVTAFLNRPRKKDGPLAATLALAAQKHVAVVGVDMEERGAKLFRQLAKQFPLALIVRLRFSTLVCDLTDDLRVQLTMKVSQVLEKASKKQRGAIVRLTLEVEADLPSLVAPLIETIRAARRAADTSSGQEQGSAAVGTGPGRRGDRR